jgi:hypothetical protein
MNYDHDTDWVRSIGTIFSHTPTAYVFPFERSAKRPSERHSLNSSMQILWSTSIRISALRSPGIHFGCFIVPVLDVTE